MQHEMQAIDAREMAGAEGGFLDIGGAISGLLGMAAGWMAHAYCAEAAYMSDRYGVDISLAM